MRWLLVLLSVAALAHAENGVHQDKPRKITPGQVIVPTDA